MKLYHGSPQDLDILKPQQAKGMNEFENLNCVFLTKTFIHAALYALGKTLKGKTAFGVSEDKLVILGNLQPGGGYVYEVEIKDPRKGPHGQYASTEELKPISKQIVFPKDYEKFIVRVKGKDELLNALEKS
jgi:hypothetical protein